MRSTPQKAESSRSGLFRVGEGLSPDLAPLRHRISEADFLPSDLTLEPTIEVPRISLEGLRLDELTILRGDIHKRFRVGEGSEVDRFGRSGMFVPRGVVVYLDERSDVVLKIFGPEYTENGEGCFLEEALNAGSFADICPFLLGLIYDADDHLRGYAMKLGEPLGKDEFATIMEGPFGKAALRNTQETGFYFYDLTVENVVRRDGEYSLIDLESLLPIEWFGKDVDFAEEHLDVMDVGFPMQEKWFSPWWYFDAVKELSGRSDVGKFSYMGRALRAKILHRLRIGKVVPDVQ